MEKIFRKLMVKDMFGKIFGDRGYISQQLFQELLEQGVFMVTRVRKNMKNKLMSLLDKALLSKHLSLYLVLHLDSSC